MSSPYKILVVDDDDDLRLIITETLQSDMYAITAVANGEKALNALETDSYDLVITDLMMPGIKGTELLSKIKEKYPETGVLLMSAYGTVETAVESMRNGAFDFITKPFSISHIESRVQRYFEFHDLQKENKQLKKKLAAGKHETMLIGQSQAAEELMYHIDVVAHSEATVFLRGESGTGKEVVARAIHQQSQRADKPFLKINCAAVPESLFESTLFGHEKGAFSGAYKSQKGIFEECDGGTLLLDEISEIPYAMQAKLLRVLQEMCIIRVGNTMEIPIDVRIIATSNRDIEELIKTSQFREDLFFRLNVFPIEIAPLRNRKSDIPLLANHFLGKFEQKYKFKNKFIAKEAMERLMAYDWPGNVRQLEHMIERAILFSSRENEIKPEHLRFENDPPGRDSSAEAEAGMAEVMPLEQMEKKMIYAALKKTNNHKTQAADLLGITVRTLRNKLNQFEQENSHSEG